MNRATVFVLFFVACFLQAGTYGLVFLLPPLFAAFGGTPADVGNVLTGTTVSILLVILYSGHITARLGRMNTIAYTGIFIALSLTIMGASKNIGTPLFVAGILLGLGWGLFYTLTPVVIDAVIKPDERVRFFTLLSVSIMAGFGLSPVLGAELEKITNSVALTFHITAACCVVSTVIFIFLKKPLRSLKLSEYANVAPPLTRQSIIEVFRSRALIPIMMVGIGSSIFVSMTNYQALFAQHAGLDYAHFFLTYTIAVVICRLLCAEFIGGRSPYATIAVFLAIMITSVGLFLPMLLFFAGNKIIYVVVAALFGVGYGVAYPIIKAMAANEAAQGLLPQTMQIFGFSYFLFLFGFPFIAGRVIVNFGLLPLLEFALLLSVIECAMAVKRAVTKRL